MTWYDDIFDLLDADGTFNGLVAGRIYAHPAPAKNADGTPLTTPYVTWQVPDTVRDHTHDGPLGLPERRLQLEAWDEDKADSMAVADAIRGALDGQTGTVGSTTGCVFLIDLEYEVPDIDASSEERRLYGIGQDYMIAHQE